MEKKETTMSQAEAPKKLSYEELETLAQQLSTQNRQLYTELQGMQVEHLFKRLDYLFKVLEYRSTFKLDFVLACVDEIKSIMTVKDNEESTEENKSE